MAELPHNGRTLRRDDPLRDAILGVQRDCKANSVPYPSRVVDDYYNQPFVWLGKVPYHTDTLDRLVLTQEARKRPIPLPDHFVIDGEKRLPGENAAQYAKYLAYRDLGPARSLNKAAKAMGRKAYAKGAANSGYYSALASRFRWQERVTAWDARIVIEARRAQQVIIEDQTREEVERRQTYLTNEWQTVEKGFEILHEMLTYPVIEQKAVRVADDGKTSITIWKPGKWTIGTVAQLMEALTKLGRLHTGLSTSNAAAMAEATRANNMPERPQMSPGEQAADEYASYKAEEAYFAALQEWHERANILADQNER